MRLLVDFLCRLGFGMAAALAVTPAAVVPAGFFRVNLLVVLGLASVAAFLAWVEVPGTAWLPAAAAAVVAWIGSIAWYAERTTGGMAACRITAVLLAAVTVLVQTRPGPVAASEALIAGLVVGFAMHAMLLGHWYLNAPGMSVAALRAMIDWALAAWGVQLLLSLAAIVLDRPGAVATGGTATALLSLRWLAGLLGLPVLLVMSRKTLDIPNTQSATGILYVACLAAILGELTAQLLHAA
ncbi:MAG: hypothetical protein ACKO4T_13840 [Planctomycetaceae bacterium]